jgi:hypothetical protein
VIVITEAEIEIEIELANTFFFFSESIDEGEWVTAHNRVGDYPIHLLSNLTYVSGIKSTHTVVILRL